MQDILYLLSRLTPLAILDILLVTIVLYALLSVIRGTQADQLVRGILILLLAAVVIGYFFQLTIFNWLLVSSLPALLLAVPVIFQPEIRRALEQLGRTGSLVTHPLTHPFSSFQPSDSSSTDKVINTIIEACIRLSERQHGALMVIERSTGLEEYVQTGAELDAELTSDLLSQVFYPRTPLHDGAVIIRGSRLVAARVLLPLSENTQLDPDLGTRHRAAVGITEQSDGLSVVVSEESGAISVALKGRLLRKLTTERLRSMLQTQLASQRFPAPWRPVRAA